MPIRMAKIPNTDQTNLRPGCGAVGMFIRGNRTWYNRFAVWQFLTKLNIVFLTVQISKHIPRYLPNQLEKLYPPILHTSVFSSFIHNAPKSETSKTSFRWMHKLWSIHTVECYPTMKRKELASHENTWMSLKCILPSYRSQSENAMYCVNPILWHSGKG